MRPIRNIAIIAHVDHGKTTLVDQILKQAQLFRDHEEVRECFLDSNDLERERGITILSKNISVPFDGVKINVIDTPGHSDFGGQVERVLNLADGVLLLVDAAEGPMPQTRFVLDKALRLGLRALVVINKIDKADARPDEVLDEVFDLFVELGADDEQLDFPVLYASGRDGWAGVSPGDRLQGVRPLLEAVVRHVAPPPRREGPVQMQVASIDYTDYVGRIGIGRVYRGRLAADRPLTVLKQDGSARTARVTGLFTFEGLERRPCPEVPCGDLCAVVGMEDIDIGDTLSDSDRPEALPPIRLDEPTLSMVFRINDSPCFGRDGRFVTSRHLRERLYREVRRDVALRVEDIDGDSFKVSGRGVLHLSILVETMRREGYEMSVSQPQVITRDIEGVACEPVERLLVDAPGETAGRVIELVGARRGELVSLEHRGPRRLIEARIPTRGLIGLRSRLMTATAGEAVVSHLFDAYEPLKGAIVQRQNGVLVSRGGGPAVPYAIDGLQQRGTFFIEPGDYCYEGMIVGEHRLDNDLVVNVQRTKQLTNVRAAGCDRNLKIAPPARLSLEEALEYIGNDELLEVTPSVYRLRKRYLTENERKRRKSAAAALPARA